MDDLAELKNLDKEVAEAGQAFEQVIANAAGIRARCDALQTDMDNVGGAQLKKQRTLVKELSAGIAAAGDAATEKRATAASHTKAKARLAKVGWSSLNLG